ncbi:tetratricopeptide repeat protein [Fundidesulfovibrio soli]|uniref:tetratricopeptide repeat protein n=1 Tax=Fundidesulfovibrio soli TaxID=2922716 RepID=UPI001FAEC21F|nr:tetratricopeptide repeat protein [Fundidesulfovibrio soli]
MYAYKTPDSQPLLRSALVVSASEGHARVDRLSLKNARIPFSRAVPGGKSALEHLRKHGADVVFIDDVLCDGTGWDFMRTLKADPRFASIPVVMIGRSVSRERVLEAIGLGCVGFMLRPYTLDTFFKHLALARKVGSCLRSELGNVAACTALIEEGQAEEAVEVLEKTLETTDEARHHYERGLQLLEREEYSQAVSAFTTAARLSELMYEAHLGLARCWQALGDEVRYRKAMTRAADICARTKRFEHYKKEFVSILQNDRSGFNPFLSLGMRLAREMDWDGAVMALSNALRLDPDNAKGHLELAKAYHFKREPALAAKAVTQALRLDAHEEEAQDLYQRWTGKVWGEREVVRVLEDKPSGPIIPDAIPSMLNAVLYVAGVVTEGLHKMRRNYAA